MGEGMGWLLNIYMWAGLCGLVVMWVDDDVG